MVLGVWVQEVTTTCRGKLDCEGTFETDTDEGWDLDETITYYEYEVVYLANGADTVKDRFSTGGEMTPPENYERGLYRRIGKSVLIYIESVDQFNGLINHFDKGIPRENEDGVIVYDLEKPEPEEEPGDGGNQGGGGAQSGQEETPPEPYENCFGENISSGQSKYSDSPPPGWPSFSGDADSVSPNREVMVKWDLCNPIR